MDLKLLQMSGPEFPPPKVSCLPRGNWWIKPAPLASYRRGINVEVAS